MSLCSSLFNIAVDKVRQWIFVFTWEEKQFTWTIASEGFNESPYFSKILKADLGGHKDP